MTNFKVEFTTQIDHDFNKFVTTICSFEIIPSKLKRTNREPETKLFKVVIKVKDRKSKFFNGYIFFRKNDKNNFVYDFKFEDYQGLVKLYPPPTSINFSKYEQFKLYLNFLKEKEILISEDLGVDLIIDSQAFIFKEKFSMDFFLEIFKACYSIKEVKLFLKIFNIEKSSMPIDFNYQNYIHLIDLIDEYPKIITRHCTEKDDPSIYLVKLYTLIFYLRRKYDRTKADRMLLNKDLYKYFADFLPKYTTFFPTLICPEELINQMFKVKLTLNIIKGAFLYTSGVEQILHLINKFINEIKNCILNEKKILIMSTVGLAQENDNLDKVYENIFEIIKYEKESKTLLFSFNRTFWESYILLNNDLKNLQIINKSIKICSELEKDLSSEKFGLSEKIHNTGINLIEIGLLKNESLLDFIKIDSYFSDRNKEKKFYRPISILKGLDFETMNDNFFEKWKASNIFIIYNFDITNFKVALIDSINDVKHFGKLLKLFDYKNNKIFDYHVITNLREKFKNIAPTFKKETCPDFVKDMAYYIYIIDFANKINIQSFLKDTIETYISSLSIIQYIYLYIMSNYKDISENAIEAMKKYLMNLKL